MHGLKNLLEASKKIKNSFLGQELNPRHSQAIQRETLMLEL